MKDSYIINMEETLESFLMKYQAVNEAKIQQMLLLLLMEVIKLLPFIKYCETASYIHRLFPKLILKSKSTLFLKAKRYFMNYVDNTPIEFDNCID